MKLEKMIGQNLEITIVNERGQILEETIVNEIIGEIENEAGSEGASDEQIKATIKREILERMETALERILV